MGKIYTSGAARDMADRLYQSYLLGQLPKEGAILSCGPHLYLLGGPAEKTGEMEPLAVPGCPCPVFGKAAPQTQMAVRSYLDWRRLPRGLAVRADASGLSVYEEESWQGPDNREEYSPAADPACVLTVKEAAKLCGCTGKALQARCETGALPRRSCRKSGNTWLLTRRAAEAIRDGKDIPRETAPHPFLLIFTTLEAGMLWGRSGDEVRSAAAGAGHRAARMDASDCRRAGHTWLVTRAAMERLYGGALPPKMHALAAEWECGVKGEE